ncbi:DUF368 domain-containing protein [Ekhidna sp.]|uniref:DUF368 domain-containing protein n=1 Tax=Ekhidna sp. TaxID=2608089 RepID=UPI003512B261
MINFRLLLKGLAMGSADVIPGVSGGTIAIITGIYEELINSIKSVDNTALRYVLRGQFKDFWSHINGAFLVSVFSGVLISIFTLAKAISYLLENQPIILWSFFFGLILASTFFVFPKVINWKTCLFGVLGAGIAYLITSLSPTSSPDHLWFVFIAGAIAICAMILPGISGSFILILLAKYEYVLEAVKSFNLVVIVVFGLGCVVGLLSFSKFIHWLLQKYKDITMAALAGFMLGSLNKIWPWKEVAGESFKNLLPADYANLSGQPSQFVLAILFCVAGSIIVVMLERFGKSKE